MMIMKCRPYKTLSTLLLTCGLGLNLAAAAVISTDVISGDPSTPGETFTVRVAVSTNDGPEVPGLASLRLQYEPSALEFLSTTAGELGTLTVGNAFDVDIFGGTVARNITTAGNGANANLLPTVFDVNFRVRNNPMPSFSILIGGDVDAPPFLLETDLATEIPVTFDSSATTNLTVTIPTPTPIPPLTGSSVVRAVVDSGDPTAPNSQFTVLVEIADNTTGANPGSVALLMEYPANAVSFVSVTPADLGSVETSDLTVGDLNARLRRVATTGNPLNGNLEPEAFLVTFQTLPSLPPSYEILFSDDPNSSSPVASVIGQAMPHTFDNTGVAITVPSPTPTPTPTPIPGNVVVRGVLDSGDPTVTNSQFTVLVEIANNTTGANPGSVALLMEYPANAVSFVSLQPADLGSVETSDLTVGDLNARLRRVATTGNPVNVNPEPEVFLVTFQTMPSLPPSYQITFMDDPNSSAPVASILGLPMPHTFDNTGTLFNVPEPTPTPTPTPIPGNAVVRGVLDSGDPTVTNSQFTVLVEVANNTTGANPGSVALLMEYPANAVSFVSVAPADLGSVETSDLTVGDLNARLRRIATTGNPVNGNPEPAAFLVTFQTLPALPPSYQISFMDDPNSSAPLASVIGQVMPRTYDNTGTLFNVPEPTPTPTPTPIPGNAIVKTFIDSGSITVPGATGVIRVEVTDNSTGAFPGSAAFRMEYPSDVFTYIAVTAGELGSVLVGAESPLAGTTVARNVATTGNPLNSNAEPEVFLVTFEMAPTLPTDFTLIITDDPASSAPLAATNGLPMPHTFDNSNTTITGLDTTPPTVVIAGLPSDTNQIIFNNRTVSFSEDITGLLASDFITTGILVTSVSGSGANYLIDIEIQGTDGLKEIQLPANVVQDLSGNGNLASNILQTNYDTTAPTVTIAAIPTPTNQTIFTGIDVTFNEDVTGLAVTDFLVNGVIVSNLQGSGANYTVDLELVTGDGLKLIQVIANAAIDNSGNGNLASNLLGVNLDQTPPTSTIAAIPSPTNQAIFTDIDVTFSEPVTGLALGDFLASGMVVSNLQGSGAAYTIDVELTGGDGTKTVQLAAGSAADAAGNGNTISNLVSVTYDTTSPSVLLAGLPANTNQTFHPGITVTFSETVTGLTLADFATTGVLVTNLQGSGNSYLIDVEITGGEGAKALQVVAGAADDASGNGSLASNVLETIYDITVPTAAIAVIPSPTNQTIFTGVQVTFSEAIIGLALDDFSVSNVALTNLQGSGSVYTVDVQLLGTDGVKQFRLRANTITDLAGNFQNPLGSNLVAVSLDTTAPSVTIGSLPTPTNQDFFPLLSVNFTENVTGLTLAAFDVNGVVLSNLQGSGASYTVDVSLVGGDGTKSFQLPASAVTDIAGNPNNASNQIAVLLDQTAPVPVIAALPSPTNQTLFPAVGRDLPRSGDGPCPLRLHSQRHRGDQPSGFRVRAIRWMWKLLGLDGVKTLQLNANAVNDAAGNQSVASNLVSVLLDTESALGDHWQHPHPHGPDILPGDPGGLQRTGDNSDAGDVCHQRHDVEQPAGLRRQTIQWMWN
jgi:hypothetical protein